MNSAVKKSLRVPISKLTSCVSGEEEREVLAKCRNKRRSGGGCNRSVSSDPSVIRSYQADLEKERKKREAMNAQKNAERAAMRAHFRGKYQLSKSPKDASLLRSIGGKVSLPRELAKMVHPETKTKDDGFNLLNTFQGLSFNAGVVTRSKKRKTSTPALANRDSCKVM